MEVDSRRNYIKIKLRMNTPGEMMQSVLPHSALSGNFNWCGNDAMDMSSRISKNDDSNFKQHRPQDRKNDAI